MTNKRFLRLQLLLVIMLTFALVCNTFSWSQRPAVKGGNFMGTTQGSDGKYNDIKYWTAFVIDTRGTDYYINGNSCTGTTYQGTKDATTGEITYNSDVSFNTVEVHAGDILYFRTEITNTAKVDTNVSLFVDITYGENLINKFFICTSSPTIKRITYQNTQEEGELDGGLNGESVFSERWIPVVNQYEIPANAGSAVDGEKPYIEWYVEFETDSCFKIDNIVLTNN